MEKKQMKPIKEGRVDILVPEYDKVPSLKMPVFFNPKMELRRDVSVSVLKQIEVKSNKPIEILDGLSATGICGIRYAVEYEKPIIVTLNDHNPVAFDTIKQNIDRNNVHNAVATQRHLNSLLAERSFDIIDIDPFGSIVPYLDMAIQSIKLNGFLFLTATDISGLCGTYPKVCRRRYMAETARVAFLQELGLRILLGYCARTAAKYDVAINPLLCYYADHYYRLFLGTDHGSKSADRCLENLGFISYDIKTCERKVYTSKMSRNSIPPRKDGIFLLGPLWIGDLFDSNLLKSLVIETYFKTKKRFEKFLGLWIEEAKSPPFYYMSSELSSKFGYSQPKLETVVKRLREKGYFVSRTHFAPGAFKTEASPEIIKLVFKEVDDERNLATSV